MILLLGDSLTEWGDWPQLLNRDDLINKGRSGDTSFDILCRVGLIDLSALELAVMMLGINDIWQGVAVDETFRLYQAIIATFEAQEMPVLVQSTVYVGQDLPEASQLNQKVDQLNAQLRDHCTTHSLAFLDLNQLTMSENGYLKAEATTDGIHFSEQGYQYWGRVLNDHLQKQFA